MSSVLDRMVQRARGELPAVEPLVAAQWTALTTQLAVAEETREHDTPPQQTQPRSVTGRVNVAPAVRNSEANGHLQSALHSESRDAGGMKQQTTHETAREDQNRSADGVTGSEEADATSEAEPILGERSLQVLNVHTVTARNIDAEASAEKAREPAALFSPHVSLPQPQRREAVREVKEDAQQTAKNAALAIESTPRAAELEMDTAIEHTEIHITIGSIEMRAPRIEATAPAFRPRVTLDEFLSRRPGAGS